MYRILLIFLLVPLAISATEKPGKYTKSKTIKKEFTVNQNATLEIFNKYGSIDIVTWSENRIEMEIIITTNGNNEDKVKKRLEQIDVEFDSNSTKVSAKTKIAKNKLNWSWFGKNNVNIEILYRIKMPVTNNVDLNMDYGGISLDQLDGNAAIDCDYGNLNIGELRGDVNTINIDYTKKSTIDYMNRGSIDADYSGLHVEKAGATTLNSDYSHMTFGTVSTLEYNCDYGDLSVADCGSISGESDYMHATVGKLGGSSTFNLDYGSLKVKSLSSDFNSMGVESSYTHIKIGVTGAPGFELSANLSYTGFKHPDGFTFTREIVKNSKKEYVGYYNNASSGNNITVKASYGSLSFIK